MSRAPSKINHSLRPHLNRPSKSKTIQKLSRKTLTKTSGIRNWNKMINRKRQPPPRTWSSPSKSWPLDFSYSRALVSSSTTSKIQRYSPLPPWASHRACQFCREAARDSGQCPCKFSTFCRNNLTSNWAKQPAFSHSSWAWKRFLDASDPAAN